MTLLDRFKIWMGASLVVVGTAFTVSCGDDMTDDSYYTFTGEMLSDYLQNPEHDFTQFAEIVKRAGKMDLFSAYGTYTCLAPTDSAVSLFLEEHGYASVDDIPTEICDTIVCTSVFANGVYSTVDFSGITSTSAPNMLNNYLQVDEVMDDVDEYGDTIYTYRFNESGSIILQMANDSVENGMVHPVDEVIMASAGELPDLMAKDSTVSIYSLALRSCGIDRKLRLLKDPSWNWDEHVDRENLYHSDNHDNWCHVPEERRYGFIAFMVPDSIVREKLGLDATADNSTALEKLYEYAVSHYTDNLTKKYASTAEGMADLEDEHNPLNRMMCYHLLPFNTTREMLTTICTLDTRLVNPVEWYRTMDEMSTLKMETLKLRSTYDNSDTKMNDLFINRNYNDGTSETQKMRGARVSTMSGIKNAAANGRYFYIDDIIAYDDETKEKVFNTRIRVDLYNLFPELFSNNIRKQDTWTYYASTDKTKGIPGENFIFPIGYLDNVDMNADGDFIYQGARNWYWSYEGDEFNLRSDNNSYDITFRLPNVPTGTYQVRMGFCLIPSRGIGQFYLDGKPQGIPLDMRSNDDTWATKYGWKALSSYSASQSEEKEAMKKNLHNQGWYHGPLSVFSMAGSGHKDGQLSSKGDIFSNQHRTIRRVIASNYTLSEEKIHTMRIKSVLALGGAELMIDYIEIVPKSVYGVDTDGKGEDDY
ncbi:MAG: fasciclin domain-containing protein [Bacteroidales bacterium]|nr:fasciclin domain-containing protein [Bacteroidales bacterium]